MSYKPRSSSAVGHHAFLWWCLPSPATVLPRLIPAISLLFFVSTHALQIDPPHTQYCNFPDWSLHLAWSWPRHEDLEGQHHTTPHALKSLSVRATLFGARLLLEHEIRTLP